jgi:hypothetical protein
MHFDLNTLLDAVGNGVEAVQLFAVAYLDVFVAIASGVALGFHTLRSRIYPRKKTANKKRK